MGFLTAALAPRRPARSIENPAVPLSSPEILSFIGLAQSTEAGVEVTTQAAMRLSVVWSCLRVRAEAFAALPFGVFERSSGGGRVEIRSHPLAELLESMTLREALTWHVDAWGNGYLEILGGAGDSLLGLRLLTPDVTRVERSPTGRLWVIHAPGGEPRAIPADSVAHVAGPGWDGISGYPVLQMHAETLGFMLSARRAGSRLLANDARPAGLLKVPHKLAPGAAEAIREKWEYEQRANNLGRVGVVGAGSEYQSIGLPPQSAQFVEQMDFGLLDVARLFLVPPHKIGFLKDAGDRANVEQENLRFASDVLVPAATRFERVLGRAGLSEADRERGRYVKIDLRGVLRADFKSRMEGYAIARMNGLKNANEIRELEDEPPIPGRAGSVYLVPLNLVDAAEDLASDPEPDPDPDPDPAPDPEPGSEPNEDARGLDVAAGLDERLLPLFRDAAERISRHELGRLELLATRLERGAPVALAEPLLEKLWAAVRERFARAFRAPVGLAAAELGDRVAAAAQLSRLDPPELGADYLPRRAAAHVAYRAAIVAGAIEDASGSPAGAARRLRAKLLGWPARSAELAWLELAAVARDRIRRAASLAGLELAWVAAEDCASPICRAAAGRRARGAAPFLNRGDPIPGLGVAPRAVYGPPSGPGCRCRIHVVRQTARRASP